MGLGGVIGFILGVPTGLVLLWLLARAITRTIWTERPFTLLDRAWSNYLDALDEADEWEFATYGDHPFVCEEMRAARENSRKGGDPVQTDGPATSDVRTHRRAAK